MLIVDAHLDLAWNAVQGGRDLRRTVAEIRRDEVGIEGPGRGNGTVALPELREGRVAVAVATLIARCTGTPLEGVDYATVAEAGDAARSQLAWYRSLEADGRLRVLETTRDLSEHVARWRAWEVAELGDPPPLGIVVSMEGADPIATPDEAADWHAAGVRIIGLTHYGPGRYAGGTNTSLGLGAACPALLAEMSSAGIALDVTHCSDEAMAEALGQYEGHVLASHSNARALVPRQRQLTDGQIGEIARRGGVIGAALDCWMLDPSWVHGQQVNEVMLARVVDQVDHVCAAAGSVEHAGIGSDLDGGFGREQTPVDLDTIADLRLLAALLRDRGYTETEVGSIMHGNWLRLLARILP